MVQGQEVEMEELEKVGKAVPVLARAEEKGKDKGKAREERGVKS